MAALSIFDKITVHSWYQMSIMFTAMKLICNATYTIGSKLLCTGQSTVLLLVSSVRSSSGYHGLLEIRQQQQATFSDFSNSSDSKVKVKVKGPNMCYIFEKHGIQGYRI